MLRLRSPPSSVLLDMLLAFERGCPPRSGQFTPWYQSRASVSNAIPARATAGGNGRPVFKGGTLGHPPNANLPANRGRTIPTSSLGGDGRLSPRQPWSTRQIRRPMGSLPHPNTCYECCLRLMCGPGRSNKKHSYRKTRPKFSFEGSQFIEAKGL